MIFRSNNKNNQSTLLKNCFRRNDTRAGARGSGVRGLISYNFFFAAPRLREKKIRVLISKKGIIRAKALSLPAVGRPQSLRYAGSVSP